MAALEKFKRHRPALEEKAGQRAIGNPAPVASGPGGTDCQAAIRIRIRIGKKVRLEKLQSGLMDTLPDTMNTLLKGLNPDLTINTLPPDLAERWLSKDGVYRIMASPSKDLNDEKNLKEFIAEVRQVATHAIDLPVIYLESACDCAGLSTGAGQRGSGDCDRFKFTQRNRRTRC